jgi:hypothetical protein
MVHAGDVDPGLRVPAQKRSEGTADLFDARVGLGEEQKSDGARFVRATRESEII